MAGACYEIRTACCVEALYPPVCTCMCPLLHSSVPLRELHDMKEVELVVLQLSEPQAI